MSYNYYHPYRENYEFSILKPSSWFSCEKEVKTEEDKCIADRNELTRLKGITCPPISMSQYENLVKENAELRKQLNQLNNITPCPIQPECVTTEIFNIYIGDSEILFSGKFKGVYTIIFLNDKENQISSSYTDNNQQYRNELKLIFNDKDKKNINNFKFIKIIGLNGFKNTIPISYD